jgi:hypothetical protein
MSWAPFTHDHYRFMLQSGHAAGYRFATFDQFASLRSSGDPACFIRHDCDNDLVAALAIAHIEAEMGVCSTYFIMTRSALYNVLAPKPAALVREIAALGHQLGLHFDEKPYEGRDADFIRAQVDRERGWLQQEFGRSIDVVSFHQPSRRALSNEYALSCLNTYDKKDMDGLHYLSDSNLRFRGLTPIQCFKDKAHRLLHILLHPEWWTEAPMSLDEKWNRMLENSLRLVESSLLEREDTYKSKRSFSIGPGHSDG